MTWRKEHMDKCCKIIDDGLRNSRTKFCRRDFIQYMAILNCLTNRISGQGKMEAAENASRQISGSTSRTGRCIMHWTKPFLDTKELPPKLCQNLLTLFLYPPSESTSVVSIIWCRPTTKDYRTSWLCLHTRNIDHIDAFLKTR